MEFTTVERPTVSRNRGKWLEVIEALRNCPPGKAIRVPLAGSGCKSVPVLRQVIFYAANSGGVKVSSHNAPDALEVWPRL